jgi:hypothetical protein
MLSKQKEHPLRPTSSQVRFNIQANRATSTSPRSLTTARACQAWITAKHAGSTKNQRKQMKPTHLSKSRSARRKCETKKLDHRARKAKEHTFNQSKQLNQLHHASDLSKTINACQTQLFLEVNPTPLAN